MSCCSEVLGTRHSFQKGGILQAGLVCREGQSSRLGRKLSTAVTWFKACLTLQREVLKLAVVV